METFNAGKGELETVIVNPNGIQEPVRFNNILFGFDFVYFYDNAINHLIRYNWSNKH